LSTAADVLHRKQTWVYAKSIQLGTAPTREKIDRDREVMTIPKEILPQLRHVIFATPPSSYGFSMSELEEMSGQNDGWLRPRIEKAGIVPIFAEHVLHKRIVYIYPKDTLERVGGRVGHAGRKYTAHAMADLLGKNFDWVDPRLKRMNAESELLQDDNGRDALHYDEEIFFILKEEAELVKSYPEAGDWLAVNGLARAVGHSPAWVNRRLPFIVTESEIRVDSIKRPGLHFEPETSDRLLKLPADILKNALPASNE